MEIPEGVKEDKGKLILKRDEEFKKEEKNKINKVLKLNKSLYGLKQSPRCWNIKLNNFLKNYNYIQRKGDQCLYFKKENNKLTIIAIYFDDCFIIGEDNEIKKIKNTLNKEFKMKDNDELKGFLGIN